MQPPIATINPKEIYKHGDTRIDNYFWMRDKANAEVIKYLEAENDYTQAIMKPAESLREILYQEILGRLKETDSSVPEQIDDYFYYSRTEQGKAYSIYCRKKGSMESAEEILLDPNVLTSDKKYISLGVFAVSHDHRFLAYSLDTDGSEGFTVYIKNLEDGTLLPDVIPNTSYSLEWAQDNQTFFYTVLNEAWRSYRVFRHRLGSDYRQDVEVYHEQDDAFYVGLSTTKSKQYIILTAHSKTTTEEYFLPADAPAEKFRLIQARRPQVKYSVEHHGNKFYIVTNDNAKNFKLMSSPVSDPCKHNWQEVIAHRDDVRLYDIDVFAHHLVVYERKNGLKAIRIIALTSNDTHYVEFAEPVYTYSTARNTDFNSKVLRFHYSSLTTSTLVFDYDMDSRTRVLRKQYEVRGGYDPADYQAERIFAKAADGTKIPISLVYRKPLDKNGKRPLCLLGYGSYGICTEPGFSSSRLSLLDRGFICAIAHIRGGEEMGRAWYEQGKLLNKKNTFRDFIACAEHLISEKYTRKEKLVITGRSAGGLLIGAVLNMRPDLFRIAIAGVPFVDALTTMSDSSLPLTVSEYEEWGNPNHQHDYDYIKSYSPYDNVTAQNYPNILVTAGINDPRVGYWEPAKWVAKLRSLKKDKNLLLLKTHMGAGHHGFSGRYEELRDIAFEYAFILHIMQIKRYM